jgi:hypothetical protein
MAVLVMVVLVRAHGVKPGAEAEPLAGHLVASLGIGLRQFLLDMAAGDAADAALPVMLTAVATKLLFALGFAGIWRQADPDGRGPGRWHAALAIALGVAALFSLAAAYDHYGSPCCERQATTRSWFGDLLLIMAMAWLLARWRGWRRVAWLSPALLTVSLYPVLFDLHGLERDYANYGWAVDGRVRTWRSAQQPGTEQMEFYMPPDEATMLVHGYGQSIGTFRIGPETPEQVAAIGRFFGKAVVVTCEPWQKSESWLIYGQFFPACPPHDGPPDKVFPLPQ